jgi:hypothetical protein
MFERTIEGRVICKNCGFFEDLLLTFTEVEDEIDLASRVDQFFKMKDWTIVKVPNEQVVEIICEKCFAMIMAYPVGFC